MSDVGLCFFQFSKFKIWVLRTGEFVVKPGMKSSKKCLVESDVLTMSL